MVTLVTYSKISFVYQGFRVSKIVAFPCYLLFLVTIPFVTVAICNCHMSSLLSTPFGNASKPRWIP